MMPIPPHAWAIGTMASTRVQPPCPTATTGMSRLPTSWPGSICSPSDTARPTSPDNVLPHPFFGMGVGTVMRKAALPLCGPVPVVSFQRTRAASPFSFFSGCVSTPASLAVHLPAGTPPETVNIAMAVVTSFWNVGAVRPVAGPRVESVVTHPAAGPRGRGLALAAGQLPAFDPFQEPLPKDEVTPAAL